MKHWAWRKIQSITSLWFESFLAVIIGIHLKDFINWALIWQAFVAASIPVIIRWVNPKDIFPGER